MHLSFGKFQVESGCLYERNCTMSNPDPNVPNASHGEQRKSLPNKDLRHRKSERVVWIDLIRITAAFLVIVGHVGAGEYRTVHPGTIPDSFWLFSNFVDVFGRCAVPLFLMVSGYLLLRKPNSLKHGYFKRLLKIGIPLLAWSIIYLVLARITGIDRTDEPVNLYNGIRRILTGEVVSHLWFLYAILSLYIAAPILHSYLKSASRESKIYFLLIWGCAWFVWPIVSDALATSFDIDEVNFNFYLINSSVGFFVAGYFFGHMTISSRICILCMVSFFILALAITWISFIFPTSMYDADSMNFNLRCALTNYLLIPLALMFFIVLKYVGSTQFYRQSMWSTRVSHFAGLTFGIYLVHVLVLHALETGIGGFSLTLRTFDPWFSLPLTASAIFLLSASGVWLLKKIPLAHWILP